MGAMSTELLGVREDEFPITVKDSEEAVAWLRVKWNHLFMPSISTFPSPPAPPSLSMFTMARIYH
jgi:hypothetical protein